MINHLKNIHETLTVTLSDKLGSGGEGTVYALADNPNLCVKIYHSCVNTQVDANGKAQVDANGKAQLVAHHEQKSKELELKIKAMIEAPPKDPTLSAGHYSICWPTHLVYEDEACTQFLGYAMPLIDKKVFKEYHLLCDKPGASSSACYRLENFGTGFTYLHMYVVALNLASCVTSIHEAGHAIGDLNDKNILVSTKDSKITIVDCDSFEIHAKDTAVFPCNVYMPEYSAPEVIKHESIADRQKSDRFALAVLVFKLLMLNTHPYSSRGSSVEHLNTPGEKIADGYYPYEDRDTIDVSPPVYALPYDIIPPNIRALFKACFVDGQHDPDKRPAPREWFLALKENYESMYAFVKAHDHMCEVNHLHMYPLHLKECPWCEMKDDYFPILLDDKNFQGNFVNNFKYINHLAEWYMSDDLLTEYEYLRLLQEGKKYFIKPPEIDLMLRNVDKLNEKLRIGNKPMEEIDEIKIETLNRLKPIFEKEISIVNTALIYDMKVFITNIPIEITISNVEFTIPQNSKKTLSISYNSEKVQEPYKLIDENITINFEYGLMTYKKDIHITGEIDNSPILQILIKKTLANSLFFSSNYWCNKFILFNSTAFCRYSNK